MSAPTQPAHDHPFFTPVGDADTLARLYLAVERRHDRSAALEHRRDDGPPVEVPDWRMHRWIVRVGLYLGERLGLSAGDHVAIIAPLSVEALVVEHAAVAQGCVAVTIGAELPVAAMARGLEAARARAVFVAAPALEAVRDARAHGEGLEDMEVVDLDDRAPAEGATPFGRVLELGGTLDTAERARSFRARARAVTPEMRALGALDALSPGAPAWRYASHGEVVAHVRRLWAAAPARRGDVAYAHGGPATLPLRTALHALLADGVTRTVIGNPGRERGEIAALAPRRILGPGGAREAGGPRPGRTPAWIRQWLASFRT